MLHAQEPEPVAPEHAEAAMDLTDVSDPDLSDLLVENPKETYNANPQQQDESPLAELELEPEEAELLGTQVGGYHGY